VQVVAALDGGDLLLLHLDGLPGRVVGERHAELVEVVQDHEQGDDRNPQERHPASVAGLADDLGGALGGQAADGSHVARRGETLHRPAGNWLARGTPRRQSPSWLVARLVPGRVGHMQPVGVRGEMMPGWPTATGSGPSVIFEVSIVSLPSAATVIEKRSMLRGAGPYCGPSALIPVRS